VAGLLYKSNRRFQKLEDEHRRGLQLRADELEQFAGRVAHDILGPLGAVSMALSIIERSATPPATRQNALARAAASLTRVQRLVDGLLDFARAGAASGPDAAADVRASVLGLLDELQPEAVRARISLAAAPVPSCAVAASQGALLSLLGNLLRNAIKYMGTSEKREVALRIAASRGSVRFEVEDTGPGIPPNLLERIFQPYVRAPGSAQPGIGLGLATVKRLVDAHGGAVGVKAAPGGGALFWFELPRAQDDAPRLEASPMVAAASEGPLRPV
jgi:signal transduction histidine kinase